MHHRGFPDESEAHRAAHAALEGTLPGSPLVVDITSGLHGFGKIVALFPEGGAPSRENRLVLRAYAGHAAAALETAAALEAAQREGDTARSLLALAQGLNVGADPAHVATQLAEVLPQVLGRTLGAAVWLWSPVDLQLHLSATSTTSRT